MTSTLANGLIADELYLNPALEQVGLYLKDFANSQEFTANMRLAFGDTFDTEAALSLGNAWKNQDFSIIPAISLLSSAELNGANGAYAATTNTIYLSAEFIRDNQHGLVDVVLEELGHSIDALLNQTDSTGDEGAIFAALVQGESLDSGTLQALKAEDDHGTITVNGEVIEVEKADFTGTNGNDNITGTIGNDNINSLDGNDTINGNGGLDNINGGAGTDTLIVDFSLSNHPTGIVNTSDRIRGTDFNNLLFYSNIEKFNITGSGNDDFLTAKADDIMDGGGGSDVINLNFSSINDSVNLSINLALTNDQVNFQSILIKNFEKLGSISLGGGNSIINVGQVGIIDGGNINGGAGIDTLIVDFSLSNHPTGIVNTSDRIRGTDYNNLLFYSNIEKFNITGSGNDDFLTAKADDIINGGNGDDTLHLDLATSTSPIVVNFSQTQNQVTFGNTSVKNFEYVGTFTLGTGDDTVRLATIAASSGGTINGSGGTDTLIVNYADYSSGIVNQSDRIRGTDYNNLLFYSNIEKFNITGSGNDDFLTVLKTDDILNGSDGNDTLSLNLGSTASPISVNFSQTQNQVTFGNTSVKNFEYVGTFTLGTGDDTVQLATIAASSGGTINGSGGTDTLIVNYADYSSGIVNQSDRIHSTGYKNLLFFNNVEKFEITGSSNDDFLTVLKTDDILNGSDGNDTLSLNLGSTASPISVNFSQTQNQVTFGNTSVKNFEYVGTFTLGTGDDTVQLATIAASSGGTINGSGGTDTLIVNYADYSSGIVVESDRIRSTGYKNLLFFNNVEKFEITGTTIEDTLIGRSGNDNLIGLAGNDSLKGNDGNDILQGTNGGFGEKDILEGGAGSDKFILGDFNWIGYDDGLSNSAGTNDYAQITDFNTSEGDIIQLKGVSTDYLLAVSGADTQILINKPGTETDELIGIIKNQTGLSLTANYFAYNQPSISLTVSPSSVLEDGATNIVYTFSRSGSTANALTVNYGITGTADSTDYTGATPGTGKTITFAVGSATATLTIDPTADTTVEANETVALTLATGTGYTIGTTTAVTGTITNDDVTLPSITLAVSPTSVSEDGTTNLIYTFTRTGATTNALTVNYGITGTANTSDYTGATPGTGKLITFAAGASTATLTIDPTADTIVESNETVALTLATGTGYTIGTTTAVTGTITNDDLLPNLNLSANQTIVEGNTNPQNVTYTVTLSSTSTQTITVQYATANGTAIAGSDYTSTSGTLTFNPGVTSQVINIPILNDSLNEANETFSLTLNSPTNASLGTSQTVTTTISDTLSAAATTTLPTATATLPTNVENLTLTGTAAINGTGNAGNNVITGNSANNTLSGLNGNDTYSFVANSALGTDTITETTTGGIDNLDFTGTTAAVNVNFGVATSQTVNSNLKLILSANNVIENATGGTGNDRLTGNALNNTLNGGDGNDQLQGLGGDDSLWGGAGNDILNGGTGNDTLWGGLGDDVLTGGVGNDKYLFQSDSVFSTSLGVDYISDFEAGLDQIVLSKITFNAITNLAGQALTDFAVVTDDEFVNASNARIVFSQGTGSLFYNQDGSILGTGTVFEFARLGNPDITLSGSNFSLIA